MPAVRIAAVLLSSLVLIRGGHAAEPDRTPLSLALSADKAVCLTANSTSQSVSAIDVATGKVSAEVPVGRGPTDIAWISRTTALVSVQHEDVVVELLWSDGELKPGRRISVGDEPHGLAVTADGTVAFVALRGDDAVAVVDLKSGRVTETLATPGIPTTVRVSPDGKWLVTCTAVPAAVFVHEIATRRQVSERRLFDGAFNPGVPVIAADSQLLVIPHAVNREFSVSPQMIDIGWVIDNRISKLPLPDGEPSSQKQLGLDIRGKAVGDAYAAVFNSDESRLVITCGGTHELLVLDFPSIPWPKGDPGDFLPAPLQKDPSRFRRIVVGGRPQGIALLSDQTALVANALTNSVQVVDLEAGRVVREISLGGPATPSLARQGEIIFYDADRSMHSWFSCHTCHTDGHTAAQVFDTRNDRSFGTPKLTPSLRGVAKTGPWTWHGWQTDLTDAMKRSLNESMSSKKPITDEDAVALVAYLSTLDHPEKSAADRGDTALSTRIEQGRALFEGRAGCISCHRGPEFTSEELVDGKVEDRKDRDPLYNPPSLRGVSSRRRFLHTGKARSLESVLSRYHRPEDLVGESLTDEERAALIEYLKSL